MKQRARALVGYFPKDEALALLARGGAADEAPTAEPEEVCEQLANRVQARPTYVASNPLLDPPDEIQPILAKFAERPDVQAAMQSHDWSVGFADLSQSVLSYQRVVITEGLEQQLHAVHPNQLHTVADVCLPEPRSLQFSGSFDKAQNAFTSASLNPNLRIAGFAVVNQPVPGVDIPQQLFGFQLSFGTRFIQLVEYQGRWMVRDGYHRIHGLLSLGITQIPCVVVRARSFEETGAGRPGFFGHEVLFSDRPPEVTDFQSDQFAVDVKIQAMMRVVRIRAEEFVVPVQEIPDPNELP
jgi:hypothetical protein